MGFSSAAFLISRTKAGPRPLVQFIQLRRLRQFRFVSHGAAPPPVVVRGIGSYFISTYPQGHSSAHFLHPWQNSSLKRYGWPLSKGLITAWSWQYFQQLSQW